MSGRRLREHRSRPRLVPIAAAAALAHLAAVIVGAARVAVPASSLPGRVFDVYAAYSGANNSYGFFAPGVAAQWRAVLDFYDSAGGRWTTRTRTSANIELAVLDSTITSLFSTAETREALAASWAGAGLGETPSAALVIVSVEAFRVPTMQQYRAGGRGGWRTQGVYAFTTDDRMAAAGVRGFPAGEH